MLSTVIGVFYNKWCLMDDMDNIQDYVNGADFSILVYRPKKETSTADGIKLRGPYMCKKFKETLEGMGLPVRNVTYSYTDTWPEPGPYLRGLGVDGQMYYQILHIIEATSTESEDN